MKKNMIIACLILVSLVSMAQGFQLDLPSSVIPPSPTSYAFTRYASYTPSLATGAVNIPIPLYEIRVKDYTLPLSLNYYTTGIQIADTPIPCGYGWTLNPGLRITRIIRGRPDDHYPMDVWNIGQPISKMVTTCHMDLEEELNLQYLRSAVTEIDYYSQPRVDTEHDLYTIHLPHGDYCFLLKKEGNAYRAITVGNMLNIQAKLTANGKIYAFEVRDENGVVYDFGKPDNESYISESNSEPYLEKEMVPESPISAWAMRSIRFQNSNATITFQWENFFFSNPVPLTVRNASAAITDMWTANACISPDYVPPWNAGGYSDFTANRQPLRLERVDFPLGTVYLNYSHLDRNSMLESILVKNSVNDTINHFAFSYGSGADSTLLQSVAVRNEGQYRFTYNSNRFDTFNCLDYFGFYNGINNTGALIPKMRIRTYSDDLQYGYSPAKGYYSVYGSADRSVDAEKMQAYILTKIEYPTGGHTTFKYSPHKFAPQNSSSDCILAPVGYQSTLTMGGGLKVTEIADYASAQSTVPSIVKKYAYGKNENDTAHIEHAPTLDTFLDETIMFVHSDNTGSFTDYGGRFIFSHRYVRLSSMSNYLKYVLTGPNIWYSQVTEYIVSQDGKPNGKTVYLYLDPLKDEFYNDTLFDINKNLPIVYHNLFMRNPYLGQKEIYQFKNNEFIPVEKTKYNYYLNSSDAELISNLLVERLGISTAAAGPDFALETHNRLYPEGYDIPCYRVEGYVATYLRNQYYIYPHYNQLVSEERILYLDHDSVAQTTYYNYLKNTLLRQRRTTSSDGTEITENFSYPMNYASVADVNQRTVLQNMAEANMQTPVIAYSKIAHGNTEKKTTNYSGFLPEKLYYQQDNRYKELYAFFHLYDNYANPLYITKDSVNSQTVYLWGYNGQYPLAKIENIDYKTVATILGSRLIKRLTNSVIPSANDMDVINNLRANPAFANALVSTYTYQPLVGMLTATDPRGVTTYYDYDAFGRLKETYIIEDGIKKPVQSYEYHYSNQ